jgi:hypothetical protein
VIHNLFEPMLPSHIQLETLSYDVVDKREYPSEEQLEQVDAIVVSGSFEDDAHADTMWTLKLAGFLIKIHVSGCGGLLRRSAGYERCADGVRTTTLGFAYWGSALDCRSSREHLALVLSARTQKDGKYPVVTLENAKSSGKSGVHVWS